MTDLKEVLNQLNKGLAELINVNLNENKLIYDYIFEARRLVEKLIIPEVGSCLSDTSTFTVSDETGDNKIQLEVPKDSKQKYTIKFNKGEYKFTVED